MDVLLGLQRMNLGCAVLLILAYTSHVYRCQVRQEAGLRCIEHILGFDEADRQVKLPVEAV